MSYKTTEKDSNQRETKLESKADFDFKRLGNAFFGLLSGALVGFGALSAKLSFASAVASGLGTALLSAASLNWSDSAR